jgi:hypothetical protein
MIATEHLLRGPSNSDSPSNSKNNMAAPETKIGTTSMRALSPTDALAAKELAMRQLWNSYAASTAVSPAVSPTPTTPALGALPLLATTATHHYNSHTPSTAFLDHYVRVVRSRALARSVLELNAATSAVYGRRVIPAKRSAINTKFSLLTRSNGVTMSRAVLMKKTPKTMMPLRAPPALPKVVPGQGLVGMKQSNAKKE